MNTFSSKMSARLFVMLAGVIPTALIAGQAFAATTVSPSLEQGVTETSSVQFSEHTAAKLQFFGSDSEQLASVFVRENGPSFVRKIRPFVRENGPSFVRSSRADGPNEAYASAPVSAVEIFAALQGDLTTG